MQLLKLLILANLTLLCTLQVNAAVYDKYGPPSKTKPPAPKGGGGYFGFFSGLAAKAGNAVKSGASGIGTVGTGVSSGLGYVGSGLFSGAGYVGSGITGGATMVGTGVSTGVGLVGTGLTTGASAVGTGMYAIGGGITTGVNGIISGLGAGTQFTILGLSKALAAVTTESLTKALGLGDLTKGIADKVDVTSIFSNILMGQAQSVLSKAGLAGATGLNYETAIIFLEKYGSLVPQLQSSINAMKTISYVIQKIKSVQNEDQTIDTIKVMNEALSVYFKDVDPKFKQKLIDISPLVYKAAFGDTDAAWKVASSLADRNTVIEALKGMGWRAQLELVQTAIAQVSDYANLIKFTAETAKKIAS